MDTLTRRTFLQGVAAGLATAGLARGADGAEALPRRPLGRTGVEVTTLVFGGGSHFLSRIGGDEAMAERLILRALDSGIAYFDTAAAYTYRGQERLSERIYGRVLPPHRNRIFLSSKTQDRTKDGALRSVETSLKLLGTDHLDLIQLHSLQSREDLDRVSAADGAWAAFRQLKEQKAVRLIGITGHYNPEILRLAIDRLEPDTLLMSLNAAQAAHPLSMTPDKPLAGFERDVLPAAVRKGVGVIAMKVMGQGHLVGPGSQQGRAEELIRYALSLQVSAIDISHTSPELLDANVAAVRGFRPMSAGAMAELRLRLDPASAPWAEFLHGHDDTVV